MRTEFLQSRQCDATINIPLAVEYGLPDAKMFFFEDRISILWEFQGAVYSGTQFKINWNYEEEVGMLTDYILNFIAQNF